MGAPWRPRGPDDLDDDQRARIRYQVLSGLRGRKPTLTDRVYDAVAVAGLPAPYVVRGLVALAVVLGLVGTATVASADALPSEPLYTVKLASEQVRLTLALSAEDRASVQLSMAEHRLTEAERLALLGMQPQAIVATSTYAADLAAAAAELATVEGDPRSRGAVAELKQRLAEQQQHAAQVARTLGAEPRGALLAPVFRTVASFAPPAQSGVTVTEAIAEHGADVAGRIATVAEGIAQASEEGAPAPVAPLASARSGGAAPTVAGPDLRPSTAETAPPAEGARSTDAPPPHASSGPRAAHGDAPKATSTRPAIDPAQARDAAERAKHEAEKAREAADKAKEAAKAPRAGSHSDDEHGGSGRGDHQGGGEKGKARP